MINVEAIVHENFGEIASVAADFGIDFSKAQNQVDCSGDMIYVEPTSQENKQKTMMVSRVKGQTLIITFFTYKGGRHGTWKYTERSGSQIKISRDSQKKTRLRRQGEAQKQKAKEQLNLQYIKRYQDSEDWTDSFPYLQKKGLEGKVRAKVMSDFRGRFLAIPVFGADGEIRGLQRIYEKKDENGKQKLFTPGTEKKGAYILVGEVSEDTESVYLVEGWADAQTIHLATGHPVYCAFDCGNLRNVAAMLLKTLSPSQIIVGADDDRWDTEAGNAGVRTALELSYYRQLKARKPCFKGFALGEKDQPKDFNDLLLLGGPDEVRRQLNSPDNHTIVRSPRKAFEFNLQLLRYAGTRSYQKQLLKTIASGIRRDFSLKDLQICLAKINFSALEVQKAYDKCMRAACARVRNLHKISLKKHPEISFTELKLDRQDHGGYLINDSFAESLESQKDIIIIKSPMGSGKTEKLIKKWIKDAPSGAYLAHRISLVEEASLRLKVMSYKGAEEADVKGSSKMGVCVNSLNHPKFDRGFWFSEMNTVFIDEASKVFSHLCGSTIADPEGVMETFLAMLELVPRVVICDADASDDLISLIKKMVPGRKITVAMPKEAPMDHIRVALTNSEDAGYEKIFSSVKKGKNVLIATDSKKEVKKLARKLGKKGISALAVHSDSRIKPEVESWIKNPNQESKKYQAVIYNSCVDSGVSVVTDHFDETIGMFKGVVTPDTIKQMMGRNRKAREWFLVVNPLVKTRYCNTEQEMYQALAAAHCKVLWDKQTKKAVPVPGLSDYDKVNLAMTRRKIQMCQDYYITVKVMLEQDGYDVESLATEKDHMTALEKEMKDIGKEIEAEWAQKIVDTTAPAPARYRKLKESYVISEDEHAEVVRFEIENTLCNRDVEVNDVRFWLNSGSRKIVKFEAHDGSEENLKLFDKHQMEKLNSLTLRKNLFVQRELLRKMTEMLNLNLETGEGEFTHIHAHSFIDWLYENKNRLLNWNNLKLGPWLGNRKPVDSTKFVKEALANMGLRTIQKNKTKKRLSHHQLDPDTWKVMHSYLEARKKAGKNIANIPVIAEKKEDAQEIDEISVPEIYRESDSEEEIPDPG